MDYETQTKVYIDIADIRVIKIKRKSKALLGAGISFLIPASITGTLYLISRSREEEAGLLLPLGLGISCYGALIGGIAGAIAGTDKTIRIEGMTDLEILETLVYLRKKARVRDYK